MRPRNPGQFQPHKIVNGRVVKDPRRNLRGRPGAKDKEPRMMRCLRCGYRNSKEEPESPQAPETADGQVKRGRGRPPGSRNKPKAPRIDDLMPGRVLVPTETEEAEPEAETLAKFAQSVLADPEVRASIRERFKSRFSPSELKTLTTWAESAPAEEKPSLWKTVMEVATPQEIRMIANIARRAMGEPEAGVLMPGSRVPLSNAAILASRAD